MLEPKFKAKWVRALKSGKFKKRTGKLAHGETYCCLGVAACITGSFGKDFGGYTLKRQNAGLPNALMSQIGLTSGDEADLIRMNDTEGKSFKEIAQYIQENL